MALSDSAVIIPGTGYMYTAPAETVIPTTLTEPESPWENLGHTSREDGLTITRDGGDTENIGTWQNPSLRVTREPTSFAITAYLHQVDDEALTLYFGPGDTSVEGQFGVTSSVAAVQRALYVRIVDGETEVGLYAPKVEISSEDDMEVDVEGFLAFPVRATVLQVTGEPLMTWVGSELGVTA